MAKEEKMELSLSPSLFPVPHTNSPFIAYAICFCLIFCFTFLHSGQKNLFSCLFLLLSPCKHPHQNKYIDPAYLLCRQHLCLPAPSPLICFRLRPVWKLFQLCLPVPLRGSRRRHWFGRIKRLQRRKWGGGGGGGGVSLEELVVGVC